MPKIRCLLTDDHTLFRQGVRRLLETEADFEVVGEASDAGESVEKARELRPDIVLMDIGMPGLSSFEAARHIRKNRPETKVLFLTIEDDGVGMPTKKVNSPRSHSFGLAGIKERVASLDGEVRVHSEKGKGTRLEIMVPARQYQEAMSQTA